MSDITHLNTETFPLEGVRLIEASAGTGKTYTLADLYLRLLLDRDWNVTEILVVTFTNAATEELRGRIRKRLIQALLYLRGAEEKDEVLKGLLKKHQKNINSQARLNDAIIRMDESSIFTIHGFSQRVLQENAFESGILFDANFATDEFLVRLSTVQDFWRQWFMQHSQLRMNCILSQWPNPEDFNRTIDKMFSRSDMILIPELADEDVEASWQSVQSRFDHLKKIWLDQKHEIVDLLSTAEDLSHAKSKYSPENIQIAYDAFEQLLLNETAPTILPKSFDFFTNTRIKKSLVKKKVAPQHLFFDLATEYIDAISRVTDQEQSLFIQQGFIYVKQKLEEDKQKTGTLYFDDLLTRLRDALAGGSGDVLAEQIRQRFPVAMIDEFQDTDPVQYQIFKQVYQHQDEYGLFMIGDPKQAIYSFRGADIFTYMDAQRSCSGADKHFTLNRNWRSRSALITAVNSIFSVVENSFIYEDIPFNPVEAADKADENPLLINGEMPPAMTVWMINRTPSNTVRGNIQSSLKVDVAQEVALACAAEIQSLLSLAGTNNAMLGDEVLKAGDIAVLVRNKNEAALIQNALEHYKLAAAYLSRESVLQTEEAEEFIRLLFAIINPQDMNALKVLFTTRLLGLTGNEIDVLSQDEESWVSWVECIINTHQLWFEQGIHFAVSWLFHEKSLLSGLLTNNRGERTISNFQQLIEIAHEKEQEGLGAESLYHWFSEQLNSQSGIEEERQLRLESDEQLVKIVTIHKSKGLEYPVVFLPFPWKAFSGQDSGISIYHDQDDRHCYADTGSEDYTEHSGIQKKEQLAEDLRLLYVALTRASQCCYLSWGRFDSTEKSALGYLLHHHNGHAVQKGLSDEEIKSAFQSVSSDKTILDLSLLPEYRPVEKDSLISNQSLQAKAFNGYIDHLWRTTSFSGLTAQVSHSSERPDYDPVESPVEHDDESSFDIFHFPRGAQAGQCLHTLLEKLDFTSTQQDTLIEIIHQQLQQYGYDECWLPVVSKWINSILSTILNQQTQLKLADISNSQKIVEMQFYFPIDNLQSEALRAILSDYKLHHHLLEKLDFKSVKGLMKGFIDLIFEANGQYYVADYKSNHLGNESLYYDESGMLTAMQHHYYDLQYLIYCVALHRYLKQRIPDYSYQHHFGGVYYLFLRGMSPDNPAGCGVYFIKPDFELIKKLDFLFKGELL